MADKPPAGGTGLAGGAADTDEESAVVDSRSNTATVMTTRREGNDGPLAPCNWQPPQGGWMHITVFKLVGGVASRPQCLRHRRTTTTETFHARIRAEEAFAELERAFGT